MWALSVNYFTYGELDRTDADGAVDGTFGAFDVATAVTASQRLWHGRLTLGASLKAIYSSIDDYTSDAYAVDLGLLARGPVPGMTLGAAIANLGTVRSGYTPGYEDSLPVLLRAGVSHRPAHFPVPMLLAADVTVPNDNDPYATFGAEIRVAGGLYRPRAEGHAPRLRLRLLPRPRRRPPRLHQRPDLNRPRGVRHPAAGCRGGHPTDLPWPCPSWARSGPAAAAG